MKASIIPLVLMVGVCIIPSFAEQEKNTTCIFKPVDQYMDNTLAYKIASQVFKYNTNVVIVSLKDQIMGDYTCQHIIKVDRAINSNDRFADHGIQYTMSGNTTTLYTYRNYVVYSSQSFDAAHVMNNGACVSIALGEKHPQFGQVYSTRCNPYIFKSSDGELPGYVINHNIDTIMQKWGFRK